MNTFKPPISTNAGDECVICGEVITPTQEGAEMHDASMLRDEGMWSEARGGSVHAECGTQAGWEVS
jgi:hypothetical protein